MDVVPLRAALAGSVLVPGLALLAAGVRELVHSAAPGTTTSTPGRRRASAPTARRVVTTSARCSGSRTRSAARAGRRATVPPCGNCSSAIRPSRSSCRSRRSSRQRCTSSSIASGWRRSSVGGCGRCSAWTRPSGRSETSRPSTALTSSRRSGVLGPRSGTRQQPRTPFPRGRRHDPRHHRVDRAGDRDEHPRALAL